MVIRSPYMAPHVYAAGVPLDCAKEDDEVETHIEADSWEVSWLARFLPLVGVQVVQ